MATPKELQPGDLTHLKEALTNWADLFCETYKEKLSAIRSSGQLKDNLSFDVQLNDNDWEVHLNLADYWKYIENGRQPGTFPPVDALINYVRTKPIIPQPYTLPNGKQAIPTENQLAFLIGRKIKEQGIPAEPLLQQTMNELSSALENELATALTADLSEHINSLFNS